MAILHPILTWGKQATAGSPPPSVTQGRFMRRWGGNKNIITPVQGYRETVIEPQQTDRETKE